MGRSSEGHSGADISREGVQRDLLPLVEGATVSTKYGMIKTDHILFIASGAFQLAKPSDLIPELQGRLPIRVELRALTSEDFLPHSNGTRCFADRTVYCVDGHRGCETGIFRRRRAEIGGSGLAG